MTRFVFSVKSEEDALASHRCVCEARAQPILGVCVCVCVRAGGSFAASMQLLPHRALLVLALPSLHRGWVPHMLVVVPPTYEAVMVRGLDKCENTYRGLVTHT